MFTVPEHFDFFCFEVQCTKSWGKFNRFLRCLFNSRAADFSFLHVQCFGQDGGPGKFQQPSFPILPLNSEDRETLPKLIFSLFEGKPLSCYLRTM